MTCNRAGVALALAAALSLAGCFSSPPRTPAPTTLPEPTPRAGPGPNATPAPSEAKSRYGNPPFYEVFGKRYYVLSSSADYIERGVASWYGPGFHKGRTSGGEPYDMYAMTAAHRTLPLPAYLRVTNLQNGRSVVVRVNDRGPFVGNRIIDLSYTAAARLDMLRSGTAMVEVRSADAVDIPANASSDSEPTIAGGPQKPLFVQAGAFANPSNAERLASRLRGGAYGTIFVRNDAIAGRTMYRVRVGPIADVAEFDRIVAGLDQAGVHDAHLALD